MITVTLNAHVFNLLGCSNSW